MQYEKDSLTDQRTMKKTVVELGGSYVYSKYMLVGEIARYLNISCCLIDKILSECIDGEKTVIDMVSKYNDILDDVVIPKIFSSLFNVNCETVSEEREADLLRMPEGKTYCEFLAQPALAANDTDTDYSRIDSQSGREYRDKTFHTDTYCFDSAPEKECFLQYVFSNRVKEVYFTGMFTSKYNGLAIQYIDPETNAIRSYYPDFITKLDDGTIQIIEVKGDNKIDDLVVRAKALAAEEMASESKMQYIMIPSTKIMKEKVI